MFLKDAHWVIGSYKPKKEHREDCSLIRLMSHVVLLSQVMPCQWALGEGNEKGFGGRNATRF